MGKYPNPTTDNDVLEACAAGDWCTREMIATAIERKVTPALIARIESLVAGGKLEKQETRLPNGLPTFLYRRLS